MVIINFKSIDELREIIRPRMSEKRYLHTLGVEKAAANLCKIHGGDTEGMQIAALLHDVAKELTKEQHIEICKKYNVVLTELELGEPKTLHQITGSIIAEKEFGIVDKDIINAVRYHTTAKADMSLAEQIIYIADYIDETRDYPDVDKMRALAEESLDKACVMALQYTIVKLANNGRQIHTDTVCAYNYFLGKKRGI